MSVEEATQEQIGENVSKSHDTLVVGNTSLSETLDSVTLRSILVEIKYLRQEVSLVKRNQEQCRVAASPQSRYSSPGAQHSPVLAEEIDGEQFNNAALAILTHTKTAAEWQQGNLEDSATVLMRIKSDEHYLTTAQGRDNIENRDGSMCNSYMNMFRKYFVTNADCSPAQGKQLHSLVNRMFTRRDSTESGDLVALDPVRKEWTKYMGELCLGKLVNPKIPRQTGLTNQDLLQRIYIISDKIRELFFGAKDTLQFVCTKTDGTCRIITLPTKEMIQAEIKQKLLDKESSEIRYIRNHLVSFERYEKSIDDSAPRFRTIDPVHERSRPIIQAWRDNRKLKGHVVVGVGYSSDSPRTKGHGKGKTKLFSYDCVSTPETTGATRNSSGIASRSDPSMSSSSSQSFSSHFKAPYQQASPAVAVLMEMEEVLLERVTDAEMGEYAIPRTAPTKKQKIRHESTGLVEHYKRMYACSDNEEGDDDEHNPSTPADGDEDTQRDFDME